MNEYMHTYIHTYMSTCMHTYILHTHTHTYLHTHIHTYKEWLPCYTSTTFFYYRTGVAVLQLGVGMNISLFHKQFRKETGKHGQKIVLGQFGKIMLARDLSKSISFSLTSFLSRVRPLRRSYLSISSPPWQPHNVCVTYPHTHSHTLTHSLSSYVI